MKYILIVDDALDLGRVLQTMLLNIDPALIIRVVPSAEEAMLETGRQPVDMLVTDIRLPGMTGLELIRKIRARQPALQTIIITGITDDRVLQQAREIIPTALLPKPLDFDQFIATSRTILGMPPRPGATFQPPPAQAQPKPIPDQPKPAQAPPKTAPAQPKPAPDQPKPAQAPPKTAPAQPAAAPAPRPIFEFISALRQSLAAQTVLILDEGGRVVIQDGDPLPSAFDPAYPPALFAAFAAAARLASLVSAAPLQQIQVFSGPAFNLVAAPAGAFGLLLVLRKTRSALRLALAVEEALAAQPELAAALQPLARVAPGPEKPAPPAAPKKPAAGAGPAAVHVPPFLPVTEPARPQPTQPPARPEPARPPAPPEPAPETGPELTELENILQAPSASGLKPDEIDAFWDALITSDSGAAAGGGGLNYAQAADLGLAPFELPPDP